MSRFFHTISRADTFVAEQLPKQNFGGREFIQVNNNGSNTRYGLFHFALPLHFRHYICIEATLFFYKEANSGWSGRTATVKRITEPWAENVTWNKKPDVAALHLSSASADGANPIEIDVTEIMRDVTSGYPFFGFQLATDGTAGTHKVHSSEGPQGLRPRLRIEYTARPDAVTNLTPNGVALYDPTPVVKWTPLYKPEHDQQSFSQVMFTQPDLGGVPDWDVADYDSGWQENTVHQWDTGDPPSGPTYAGIPDGEQRFWRVRIKDVHGNVSNWSTAAEVSYESGGTVEIISPATDDENVQDTTPQVGWDFTPGAAGLTQHAYRMKISVERSTGWVLLHDTDWVHETDNDVPVPRGIIRHTDMVPPLKGRRYRVRVAVRDAGKDDFGYVRAYSDTNVPFDTRTFIFRNGVLVEGELEAVDGGAPEGAGTMFQAVGIPSGSDLTYAMDTTPTPHVELIPQEVDNDKIYFYPGKNLLSANQSSAETSNPATSPNNCTVARSTDFSYAPVGAEPGTYSVKAISTADADATFYIAEGGIGARVFPGRTYVASAWVHADPDLGFIELGKINCGLVFYDSSNAEIGGTYHYGDAQSAYPGKFARAVSDVVVAPAGSTHAGIKIRMNSTETDDFYYFDAFQVEESDFVTGWVIGDSINVGDEASIVYNGIERPTGLEAHQPNPVVPVVHLKWQRSSTPDEWAVVVDDEMIAHIDGPDAENGDGSYGWTWHGMKPRVPHSVSIRAKTWGVGWSGSSNEVQVKYVPRGIHLMNAESGLYVPIYGEEEIEESLSRDGNTYYLVGRRDPVRINGPARGMYGKVRGTIIKDSQGDAEDHMRALYKIFGLWSSSPHLRLVFGHQAYHVIVANLTESQRPTVSNEAAYDISFDWWQTGGFNVPVTVHP